MTQKRFRKLLRAHATSLYLQNRVELSGWIGKAYRVFSKSTAKNYAEALEIIKTICPVV